MKVNLSLLLLVVTTSILYLLLCSPNAGVLGKNNNNNNKQRRPNNNSNERPVIGILAQPVTDDERASDPSRYSYIAASYVKYIEGAGARVVPIPFDMPMDQIISLVKQLNGLLLPGGGANLNNTYYYQVQRTLVEMSMQQKQKNLPIWATCLGMQAISMIGAQDVNVLSHGWDSWNISMPLQYYPSASQVRRDSVMFNSANMPSDVMFNTFQNEPVTLNNHHDGISVEDWFNNENLVKTFRVTSINKDRRGRSFVSTIEAYNFPIYAVQWHPEKPIYEWREDEDINHSYTSVLANQYMANFFVNECRKNGNTFISNSDLENKWLIYNYPVTYSFSWEPDFVQIYYFPRTSSQK